MKTKSSIFFLYILLLSVNCFAQTPKKTLKTKFISEKITIDGKFDEEAWKTADIATDFFMIAPDNGKQASKERQTEVKIVYDNTAIYVAATLYDENPTKQRKELTVRDNFATAEHFGVLLNGYNDGQQEFRFFVSSAGVQIDILYTEANGEDFSYNSIWDSSVELNDKGWAVEMRIPYAALRFSSEQKQTWGLNLYREFQRDRQQYSWNLIDNKISNEAIQAGILDG
ncbi:carbohydrate binding family 9 domain-containing protein, partial [Flavobacterium sp.]|uniref:carbohydrate binding family 9 domain-containing protein n=1 Tax=Flavobacterium sp. TaxID=239 RepID=UPI00375262F1